MGYLDTFELVSAREKPFITLRDRSITFSKTAIEMLDFTPYIHMYIDKKGRKVAFQKSEFDADTISFYKKAKTDSHVFVRISDKAKAELLWELIGKKGSEKGIRIYGDFIKNENLIGFDLSSI